MVKVGIIGCGTIGSALAQAIEKKFRNIARLAFVSDINPAQIEKLRRKLLRPRFRVISIPELIRTSDLVIETASVGAAAQAVPIALRQAKDILTLSVGGLVKIPNLRQLLSKAKGNLYLASGAIAGIDAVLGTKTGQIQSVRITTRKPLKSLRNAPYFEKRKHLLKKIKKPTLIFQGNATQAIRNFPENVNVAVTLSLAGIGPQRTRVRIFASPNYRYNMHEIEIKSRFGRIVTQVINLPSRENPKTSALAIGSAIATLEKIFNRLKVGT